MNRNCLFYSEAQSFLLSIYQGAIGGISGFWFVYSYWLILSVFYHSFAVIYKSTKEDAENEIQANRQQRAIDLSHINISALISGSVIEIISNQLVVNINLITVAGGRRFARRTTE